MRYDREYNDDNNNNIVAYRDGVCLCARAEEKAIGGLRKGNAHGAAREDAAAAAAAVFISFSTAAAPVIVVHFSFYYHYYLLSVFLRDIIPRHCYYHGQRVIHTNT